MNPNGVVQVRGRVVRKNANKTPKSPNFAMDQFVDHFWTRPVQSRLPTSRIQGPHEAIFGCSVRCVSALEATNGVRSGDVSFRVFEARFFCVIC